MRILKNFAGINNVLPPDQLRSAELTVASNVDIDLTGTVQRRAGLTKTSATPHYNLWEAAGFSLASRGAAGDLVNVDTGVVLVANLGNARVWYTNLPDGRVLCGNGTAQYIVGAASATPWGVPIPAGLGEAADVLGLLHPGDYQYAVTHQRIVDGVEGGPRYTAGALSIASGGVSFTGLPLLAGHRTNVYLTSQFGGERYFVGSTTDTGAVAFTGSNAQLQRRCPTEFMKPPPQGRLHAFWRGRTLVAVGTALFASRPHSWELFDLRRDFKAFSAPITMVQPTDGGIWVGTQDELAYLQGDTWDGLTRQVKLPGPVVLGSGVKVAGEHIRGESDNQPHIDGDCVVCIADGWLVAGTSTGDLVNLTLNRYRTDVTEVAASFRLVGDVPQYVAIAQ